MVPRGAAAGYTIVMPEQDRLLVSASKLRDDMAYILGGRAAEELAFGEVTTGASNDLMKATDMARKMITHYGMSEALGPVSFSRYPDAHEREPRSYSEAKAMQIDEEIRRMVEEAYERAKSVLGGHRGTMEAVVAALHERETLSAKEFAVICEETISVSKNF
jgi:cell division protease FtsH